MRESLTARGLLGLAGLGFAVAAACGPARASGILVVAQDDGSTKTYRDVFIRIQSAELAVTSSDGQGTLVIGKAACTKEGALIKCLPYDATLYQHGGKYHIFLKSGTVWLNPTSTLQSLSLTTAHLQPHGVMMSVTTKKGTYVSLTGTVDELER